MGKIILLVIEKLLEEKKKFRIWEEKNNNLYYNYEKCLWQFKICMIKIFFQDKLDFVEVLKEILINYIKYMQKMPFQSNL